MKCLVVNAIFGAIKEYLNDWVSVYLNQRAGF